jgi:hypothetical protein
VVGYIVDYIEVVVGCIDVVGVGCIEVADVDCIEVVDCTAVEGDNLAVVVVEVENNSSYLDYNSVDVVGE